jgi:Brp/Blh family beta-carotene 15,15'-monooxygenase
MKPIENSFKILGFLICLFFSFFYQDSQWIEMSLFVLILFMVGIPHGAIDHLISNPVFDIGSFKLFLMKYLFLIGIYLIVWYFFPLLALLAFLVMSSYHFGQTHFIHISSPIKLFWLLNISRGGYFLAVILVGNWDTTRLILSSLTSLEFVNEYKFWVLGIFSILTLFFQTFWGPKWSKTHLIELMILGPVLYFTPLLIGFIVYFGFWHSLPSMLKEYDFLRTFKTYDTPTKFAFQLVPFTLISLVGIAVILFLGIKYLDENELILLFFILISLISFPHILYMDQFLRKKIKTD